MSVPPENFGEAFGYAEALELVHRGHLEEARARARAATANAGAGPRAGALSDLMAAAMTELLADLPDSGFYPYPPELEARASAVIDIALAAGRPAWAAAVRGIQCAGLTAMGRREDSWEQLRLGEAELAQEVERGGSDPLGKPQGVAAAHNNLGYAYLLMEAFELALPHLKQASALSRWGYGPALSVQAYMDVFNLGELHLRWAMLYDALGDSTNRDAQAELALDAAQTLTGGYAASLDSPWPDAAVILTTGARLLTDPESITEADLQVLRGPTQAGGASFLRNLALCLMARAARLLGDGAEARRCADDLQAGCKAFDPLLFHCAARDSELAQSPDRSVATAVASRHRSEAVAQEALRQAMVAELQGRVGLSS